MNDQLLTYRGTVYPWHCDHMGHMNVMWYTGKFDEASWQFLANLGLTRSYLREHDRGLAALQQNTTYKRELHPGDIITIHSGILEMKEKTIRFLHRMINDETGEVAAITELTGIYMDLSTRRSCALPQEVVALGHLIAASTTVKAFAYEGSDTEIARPC